MDSERKRELQESYRQMRPQMGVLSFTCTATGQRFLHASKNVPADINSITFKLNSGYYPNRALLDLWQRYGEDGFSIEVIQELEYRDDVDDYTADLETLRELCMQEDPAAQKLWR